MSDQQALSNISKFLERMPTKTELLVVESAEIEPDEWAQTRLWLLQQTELQHIEGVPT